MAGAIDQDLEDLRGKAVISVRGLAKSYGDVTAISDINFEVRRGEIFGLLGPNGAGKTTTIEIIEGHRRPTSGSVSLLGEDPAKGGRELHERIGVMLQSTGMQYDLTPVELLTTFRTFYGQGHDPATLIEWVGLEGKAHERVETLSGGQRRRLDLALSLVGAPEVLFLDEPTTGFDPEARHATWDLLRRVRDDGTTIILNTHLMPEAEALCDRVGILRDSQLVELGPPRELRFEHAAPVLVVPRDIADIDGFPPDVLGAMEEHGDQVVLQTSEMAWALSEVSSWALQANVSLDRISVVQPGLEDIYLELTAKGDAA